MSINFSLCTDWRNQFKNVFLQQDHVPSKHEPPLSYMVTVVTILWPHIQIFSKRSPEQRNYLRHFLADSYVKNSKTDAVQQCTWVKACCYILEGVRNAFMSNKPYDSLARDCHPRHSHMKTVRDSWRGRILTVFGPPFPQLTPCDFYLGRSLKDKVYKTNPYTLKELWNNICCGISTISSKNNRE